MNTLSDKGSLKKRKRVGRGIGSGTGKTSGAGHKGQKSRSGVSIKGFEGGQMPLYRRLPKRGFNNPFRMRYEELNLKDLNEAIKSKKLDSSKEINETHLQKSGLIKKIKNGVKLLGNGKIDYKVNMKITKASKKSIESIEKAGGKINISPLPNKPSSEATRKGT